VPDAHLDHLEHERPAHVGVLAEIGFAQVEQTLDAALGPGPFEQMPLDGRRLAERRRPARQG
jgi:hypothetical protein